MAEPNPNPNPNPKLPASPVHAAVQDSITGSPAYINKGKKKVNFRALLANYCKGVPELYDDGYTLPHTHPSDFDRAKAGLTDVDLSFGFPYKEDDGPITATWLSDLQLTPADDLVDSIIEQINKIGAHVAIDESNEASVSLLVQSLLIEIMEHRSSLFLNSD
jgi:hypothetical protein